MVSASLLSSLTGVHLCHHDGFGKLDPEAPGILAGAFADLHSPLTNCGEGEQR